MIVVTTPTGRIGARLTADLLDRGAEVTVVVRNPAGLDARLLDRVRVVEGSHADPAVLDRALPGADALFWLVPPNPAAPSAEEHYLAFARPGAEAIRRHGIGHVVGVTSAGHGWPAPAGVLSAAFAMDDELMSSGAAYRGISLPFYMENLQSQLGVMLEHGVFSLTCAADQPLAMIATRDIAVHAAHLLTDLDWAGQENEPVFGPDRLTPGRMAEVISQELGRPEAYQRMTLDDLAGMARARGASEQAVTDLVQMFAAQDDGIYDEDWGRAIIAPTDFRTWCREVLAPAVP